MSRIGKQPVALPSGVKVDVTASVIKVEGPNGKLETKRIDGIDVAVQDNEVTVTRKSDTKRLAAFHGLTRSLVFNMVEGVSKGFEKILDLEGVGYRAKMVGKNVELSVGYSNPVLYQVPEGIEASVDGTTTILIKGADKQKVGQVAAEIRKVRPPEPYKGKGIRYRGERILRKAGKAGGK